MIAISSYLSYRYPVSENTMFDNIKSLLPGYYIAVDLNENKKTTKQYWDLPLTAAKEDLGEEYYIEKIRNLMLSSVRYRMISDVNIGAYLSGGLDSSIIVALMSKSNNGPVKTFTIGFEEENYNEFNYAKLVSDMYETDHHEILLSAEDYIENMIKLIKFKDAPLGIANEPALYVMSKELKKYITVVLSREGADEIFRGYGT
ncbi:MAG: asparagine synthase C-terminal domain-containing protein [Bacteroidetes bacterium]|nr:asparagine synthase C-terminal domain-containing protein [Bacteroidota bacterium]